MPAAAYVELAAVIERTRDPAASRPLDGFLTRMEIEIIPVSQEQARTARRACWDYGRGGGHPAHLNSGDRFCYALARERGESLLFKGDGFPHPDDLGDAAAGAGCGRAGCASARRVVSRACQELRPC